MSQTFFLFYCFQLQEQACLPSVPLVCVYLKTDYMSSQRERCTNRLETIPLEVQTGGSQVCSRRKRDLGRGIVIEILLQEMSGGRQMRLSAAPKRVE